MPRTTKDQDLHRSKRKAARSIDAEGRAARRRSRGPGSYAQWTLDELKDRARELGLNDYSGLTKKQLIDRLREH